MAANKITSANAGERRGFTGKSRVVLRPRPGVAEFRSLAIPLLALFVVLFLAFFHGEESAEDGMYRFFVSAGIVLVGAAIGFVSGLIALARRERLWGLALVGLTLDSYPIILVVVHNVQRHS